VNFLELPVHRCHQCLVPNKSLATAAAAGVMFFALAPSVLRAQQDPNEVILSLLREMPSGGGYLTSAQATRSLENAVRVIGNQLAVAPASARPSFCSGATYVVFVKALQRLAPSDLTGQLAAALAVRDQPDGAGVWGRWNANGPGTACLFHELQLGRNFTDFEEARPGDFMKIFWNTNVGRSEHGHSVIYLGSQNAKGVQMVSFWSSNKQTLGFGQKSVPRSRIAYAIFSRLEYPRNIERVLAIPARNSYLAGLTVKSSSLAEAAEMSGAHNN
jgi:hypothetical protein